MGEGSIDAILDFVFTLETYDKSCKFSIAWKKECRMYTRPMFSLNASLEGVKNTEGIHTIYKNGHVTEKVKEGPSGP